MAKLPKPEDLLNISFNPPRTSWMKTKTDIREGFFCHAGKTESVEKISLPNARDWRVPDDDWKLPADWQTIILNLSLIHI